MRCAPRFAEGHVTTRIDKSGGGSQTIPVGDLDLSDFELDLWDLPYLECTSHHPNATLLQCFSVFVLMV